MKQKQVKRICAMLMAGILAAGCLAGCGNTDNTTTTSTDAATSTEVATDAATGDDAAASTDAAAEAWKPEIPDGPFTIEIYGLMGWEAAEGTVGQDLYYFKYMENWLREQGYDVTFKVDMAWDWSEGAQQFALMCGTNDLPDLHIHRVESDVQSTYGWAENMFMDWNVYLNETYMPNAVAALEEFGNPINPEVLPNGEYYEFTLPSGTAGGLNPDVAFAYVNQTLMKKAGFDEMPTTTDDMEALLYAMKATADDPDNFWSLSYRGYMFTNYYFWGPAQMWTYPNTSWGSKYFLTADGGLVYGAKTEVWDDYVTTYNKWMNDGLMHPDALTLDNTTKAAMCSDGQFGVFCCYHMADVYGSEPTREQWEDWVLGYPLTNSETGKESIWNVPTAYGGSDMGWTIAEDSEYKEILVYLADHMCTPEASFLTIYGPKAGEDPLNEVPGWVGYDAETGSVIQPEGYETFLKYQHTEIMGWMAQGFLQAGPTFGQYKAEQFGYDINTDVTHYDQVDVITGQHYDIQTSYPFTLEYYNSVPDEEKTADMWLNCTGYSKRDNLTAVYITDIYLDADAQLRADELQLVISEYCTAEGAKFVTGTRPISEIPDFHKTLEEMGVDELEKIYQEATLSYRQSIWGDSVTE